MAAEILDLQVHPAGALELLLRVDAASLDFAIEDGPGALYEVTPVRRQIGRDVRLNLIQARDVAAQPWRLKGDADGATLGPCPDLDARLDGHATYCLQVRNPKSARAARSPLSLGFIDPATGGATPITPGGHYRFEVLIGLRGGTAELAVTLRDDGGRQIEILRRQVSTARRGGRDVADFDAVGLSFTAPREACALSIGVTLSGGEPGAETMLLLAAPSLSETIEDQGPPAGRPVLEVSRQALAAVRRGGAGEVSHVRLPLPAHLLDGAPRRLTLHVWAGDDRLTAPNIEFAFRKTAHIGKYRYDPSGGLRVSGRAADHAAPAITLQLTVDGEPSTVRTLACADGKFDGLISAAARHLDGRPHLLEIRDAETQASYCSAHAVLPRQTMLFSALQSHARAPLSPGGAPALPHHRRAYAAWAARVARGATAPDLSALQAELLGGFRKRQDYPPIAFPAEAAPRVSVIVPAHDKFEVSYFGLCALLFAACEASFEVILVDDGSSDRTAELETVVSGVTVVRHARAQGFVAACNDGAAAARGQYLVFLNNDTEVTAGWLDELLAVAAGFEDVGLVGCKLVYPDGRLQEAGGIVWGTGDPWNVGRNGKANDPAFNYLRQIDYASGAALMIPRPVWDAVGGFTSDYAPAYFEDTDLAMKVADSGRRVLYAPGALVYHHEGQSAGVDVGAGMKRFQEVNRPKFKRRWRHLYAGHGREVGERPEREKDRGAVLRALVIDRSFPDAREPRGHETFQTLRALATIGVKATVLPWSLVWSPQVAALQRSGVECLHAPFVRDVRGYLRKFAMDYDLILINGMALAADVISEVKAAAPATRLVVDVDELAGHHDELDPSPDLDWLAGADLLIGRAAFAPPLLLSDLRRAQLSPASEPRGSIGPLADSLRLALTEIGLFGAAEPGLVLKRDKPLQLAAAAPKAQ